MTESLATILLIEDEPHVRRFLRAALAKNGYRVVEAVTAEEGITLASTVNPDVVLLDLGLPDVDGIDVTRRLREWMTAPIVVISARGREQDKVDALDVGADDYLTKPFGLDELLARLRVAMRHAAKKGEAIFVMDDLRVDREKRIVQLRGEEVHLTPIQYKLLVFLVRHAGKVLTHRQILSEVWGPAYATQAQYLRVYMGQLRQKLEVDPARPRYLLTEPGVGYRLKPS